MGIFSNLNTASAPTGGGFYFEPGEYEVEVTAVKQVAARGKGPLLVVETLVLESSTDQRPVGSRPAWTQAFYGKSLDIAPQNAKMFFVAASGLNIFEPKDAKAIADEDWDAFGESALEDSQPLKGCRVHVSVSTVAGKVYYKHLFTPPKKLSEFQLELAKARS